MGTIHKIKNLPAGAAAQQPQQSPRERRKHELFKNSLEDFTNRLLSVRFKKEKISRALSHVREFFEYSHKFPWNWTGDDFEAFSAHLARDLGNESATQRMKQLDIKQYTEYLMGGKYARIIEQEFGIILKPVCHKDNMIVHKVENDNATGRRNLTQEELNEFFTKMDEHIIILSNTVSKGFRPAQRDKAVYGIMAMYGLRNNETVHLDIDDIGPNPDHPEFGNYGRIEVWFGKSTKGSNPRHRTVWTTDIQAARLLEWYVMEVRPHFIGRKTKDEDIKALFFSERGRRISHRTIQTNLKSYLKCFGMYEDGLVPHSLRHSFISCEQENCHVSSHFVQKQVGHEYNSTTQGYTHFGGDFYKKALDDTIDLKLEEYRRRRADEEKT